MQPSYHEDLKVGDRIAGRYEILAEIGRGSIGVVYKAKHDILGRIVAIKMLRVQTMTDDRSRARFEREARATERLSHPNLIGVIDFGYTPEGIPYLIMDFVSGISLYDILKKEACLRPERAVTLYSQVCDAMYHAHQRGVIHRDLKPANILIVKNPSQSETVKIVDLGVAKIVHGGDDDAQTITRTGEVCGSPLYLSPEQCMYLELDPRTDIYSLGVCLYESLTGAPPLRGATVYDTLYMHVHENPKPFSTVVPSLEIPRGLEEVVLRCLAKDPNARYQTMEQVKEDLIVSLKPAHRGGSVHVLPPEVLFKDRKPDGGQNNPLPLAESENKTPVMIKSIYATPLPKGAPAKVDDDEINKNRLFSFSSTLNAFLAVALAAVLIGGLVVYIGWQNERIKSLELNTAKPSLPESLPASPPQTFNPAPPPKAFNPAPQAQIYQDKTAIPGSRGNTAPVAARPQPVPISARVSRQPLPNKAVAKQKNQDGSASLALAAFQMQGGRPEKEREVVPASAAPAVPALQTRTQTAQPPLVQVKPGEQPVLVSQPSPVPSKVESTVPAAQLAEQARALALAHDFVNASLKFRQAYKMEPSNQYYKSCLAHSLTTEALLSNKQGNYAQAVAKQKEALQLSPENSRYQSNLEKFEANLQNFGAGR